MKKKPSVSPALWARICGHVGRPVNVPIAIEAPVKQEQEFLAPPVPYCGLMNPQAFASLKKGSCNDK